MPLKHTLTALGLVVVMTSSARGESSADLRARVETLKVTLLAARHDLDPLVKPLLKSHGLDIQIGAAVFSSLFTALNSSPDALRVFSITKTGHNGQLWGWDADCDICAFGICKKYSEEC